MPTAVLTEKDELLQKNLPKELHNLIDFPPEKLERLFLSDIAVTIDRAKTNHDQVAFTVKLTPAPFAMLRPPYTVNIDVMVFDNHGKFAELWVPISSHGGSKNEIVKMPPLLKPGNRQYFVVADPRNFIRELNEENNFATITVP